MKKGHERDVLTHLLRHAGIETTDIQENEGPDFLLDVSGQRIGAEVTEYVRGRPGYWLGDTAAACFHCRCVAPGSGPFASKSRAPLWVTVDAAAGTATVTEGTGRAISSTS